MTPTTKRIQRLLVAGNKAQLKNYVKMHHPVDVAAAISKLRPEDILNIVEIVGNHVGLEIFGELEVDTQKACMEYADPERIINFFEHMSTDEQVDLLKLLDPAVRESVLALLGRSDREDLMKLVKYEEGTAGSEMAAEYFALGPDHTAGETLNEIRRRSEEAETIYTIYIVDDQNKLIGVVSLKDLVLAKPEKPLSKIMNPNVITVTTTEDIELVARKIAKYDLLALPVVNARRELKGIITVDDIIDIIEEETTEDIYAMGAAGAPIDYLGSGIFNISRQRITWLLALVFSGFIAGMVLKLFENELAVYVQLAFFVPLLMGSAGNAGTQTTTVIVRGLATGELTPSLLVRVLLKELRVGMTVGLVMGTLAGGYIMVSTATNELDLPTKIQLALTVSISMVVVVSLAKTTGSILPILFKKMNLDPALMSGPLLASMVDILTIIIYLSMAKLFLPGI